MKRFFLYTYAGVGLLTLSAFAAGPALAYFDLLPSASAFGIFFVAEVVSVPMILIGAAIISRGGASPAAVIGTFASLVPAASLIYLVATFWKFPAINDISTDSAFPPQITQTDQTPTGQTIELEYPKANKAVIAEHYPDIQSLGLETSGERIFGRIQDFVRNTERWTVASTQLSDKESILQAEVASPIFHFIDDIAIRVTNVSGGHCVVDVRSRSRVGRGDLGANAGHIREILSTLQP